MFVKCVIMSNRVL